MLKTNQIENALKNYPDFRGVFAVDQLPKFPKKGLYIANTHPSNKVGEHWVLYFIPQAGCYEFFDTFGRKPKERWQGKWLYNTRIIQSPLSTACGYHVLAFAYLRRKHSFRKILSLYGNNLVENDNFVKYIVKQVYNIA